MSENKLMAQDIKVLKHFENESGPNKILARDMNNGEEGYMAYWPELPKGRGKNPVAKYMTEGAELRVGLYKKSRVYKGKEYTDYVIDDAQPLADAGDANEVFGAPTESKPAPPRPVQQNDREKSICYQSARKDAAVMEAAFLISMGWELWEKERGWKAFKATTEDCYRMVNDLAANGYDIFED